MRQKWMKGDGVDKTEWVEKDGGEKSGAKGYETKRSEWRKMEEVNVDERGMGEIRRRATVSLSVLFTLLQ